MIDVKELRIGNCVNISNKEYHPKLTHDKTILKVAGISMHPKGYSIALNTTDITKQDVSPFISQFVKYIKPIKITEGILLKCGFRYSDKLWESKVYMIDDWFVSLESGICVFGFKKTRKSPYTVVRNDIKYLHTLQDCYYSITGKELDINL